MAITWEYHYTGCNASSGSVINSWLLRRYYRLCKEQHRCTLRRCTYSKTRKLYNNRSDTLNRNNNNNSNNQTVWFISLQPSTTPPCFVLKNNTQDTPFTDKVTLQFTFNPHRRQGHKLIDFTKI